MKRTLANGKERAVKRRRAGARSWLLAAATLATVALAGCPRPAPPPKPPKQPADSFGKGAIVTGNNFSWFLKDPQQRPLWDVWAEKGSARAVNGIVQLEKVRCKLYSEGKPSLEAVAPQVELNTLAMHAAATGGVSVRSADGRRTFRSDRVSLRVKENRRSVVEADGAVRVVVDGAQMTGTHLVTDARLEQGRLTGQ